MILIKWYRQYKQFRVRMRDQKMNREQVGIDRFGNKYYQYFSYYGLPTSRQIEYVSRQRWQFYEDKAFFMWMRRWNALPPSPQEVTQYQIDEEFRRKKAFEWDTKEQKLMQDFKKQRQLHLEDQMAHLEKINQQHYQHLEGEQIQYTPVEKEDKLQEGPYKPHLWQPNKDDK